VSEPAKAWRAQGYRWPPAITVRTRRPSSQDMPAYDHEAIINKTAELVRSQRSTTAESGKHAPQGQNSGSEAATHPHKQNQLEKAVSHHRRPIGRQLYTVSDAFAGPSLTRTRTRINHPGPKSTKSLVGVQRPPEVKPTRCQERQDCDCPVPRCNFVCCTGATSTGPGECSRS